MSRADPLRIADYLQHILEAIDNIQAYIAEMDQAAFTQQGPGPFSARLSLLFPGSFPLRIVRWSQPIPCQNALM